MSNSVTITREEFTKAANATIDFLKSQNIEASQTLFCSYLSDVLFEDVKADIVEVVRCRDCKHNPSEDEWIHCNRVAWWNSPDDYCSRGERKEVGDESNL